MENLEKNNVVEIRNRTPASLSKIIVSISAILSTFLSIYMLFGVGNFLNSYVLLDTEYMYAMIALLLPLPFLLSGAVTVAITVFFLIILSKTVDANVGVPKNIIFIILSFMANLR